MKNLIIAISLAMYHDGFCLMLMIEGCFRNFP